MHQTFLQAKTSFFGQAFFLKERLLVKLSLNTLEMRLQNI